MGSSRRALLLWERAGKDYRLWDVGEESSVMQFINSQRDMPSHTRRLSEAED